LSRRISWRQLAYPSIMLLPLMICLALLGRTTGDLHLFARWGAVAWLAAVIVNYRLLFICEAVWPERAVFLWHLLSFWLLTFILSTESEHYIGLLAGGGVWQYCAWGVVPGLVTIILLLKGEGLSWPVRRFQTAYFGPGAGTIMVYLLSHAPPQPQGRNHEIIDVVGRDAPCRPCRRQRFNHRILLSAFPSPWMKTARFID
jgi:hypothetical protein